MAVSSYARAFPSFECRSDPDFSGIPRPEIPRSGARFTGKLNSAVSHASFGLSSMILRFPPNFVRQLSNKARRNCSNIGVAQVVAASWSNNQPAAAIAAEAAAAAASAEEEVVVAVNGNGCSNNNNDSDVQLDVLTDVKYTSFLSSDGSLAIHAGMYLIIYIEMQILKLLFCLCILLLPKKYLCLLDMFM